MSRIDQVREFLRLAGEISLIVRNQHLSWETKHVLIFCNELSGKIASLKLGIDFYHNTMPEENVRAYFKIISEKADELQHLIDAADNLSRGPFR